MSFNLVSRAAEQVPHARADEYLTDGANLFRVISSTPELGGLGTVVLEDCWSLGLDAYTMDGFRALALTPVACRDGEADPA